MLVTVTDKGQLTVPKAIRDQLGIQAGTKLDFEPQPDGTLKVRVLTRGPARLFGLLHRPGRRPLSIEEIDAGISVAVAARARRAKD
jgi:antitoxin PrlF